MSGANLGGRYISDLQWLLWSLDPPLCDMLPRLWMSPPEFSSNGPAAMNKVTLAFVAKQWSCLNVQGTHLYWPLLWKKFLHVRDVSLNAHKKPQLFPDKVNKDVLWSASANTACQNYLNRMHMHDLVRYDDVQTCTYIYMYKYVCESKSNNNLYI